MWQGICNLKTPKYGSLCHFNSSFEEMDLNKLSFNNYYLFHFTIITSCRSVTNLFPYNTLIKKGFYK